MQDFKKLQAWQKAHRLVLETYAKTANFPREEQFGLTAQVRRAAVSIAANIAEGSSRSGEREFAQFLRVAAGSASEVEYFAILIADLSLLSGPDAAHIAEGAAEVRRMLSGLLTVVSKHKRS
jgi:four helix bundle protein